MKQIILLLISWNIIGYHCKSNCNTKILQENFSNLFGFQINLTRDYLKRNSTSSNKDCPSLTHNCCNKTLSSLFNLRLSSFLHQFSGLSKFENELKSHKMALYKLLNSYVDAVFYKNNSVLLRSNRDSLNIAKKLVLLNLRTLLLNHIKNGVPDKQPNILSLLITSINNTMSTNKCLQIKPLSSSSASFWNQSIEILMPFSKHFNLLSWHLEILSSMIRSTKNIDLSNECKTNLRDMIYCGVCSGNLRWSYYTVPNTIVHNEDSNLSMIICPQYCLNTIYPCLSHYQALFDYFKDYLTEIKLLLVNLKENVDSTTNIINQENPSRKLIENLFQKITFNQSMKCSSDIEKQFNVLFNSTIPINKCILSNSLCLQLSPEKLNINLSSWFKQLFDLITLNLDLYQLIKENVMKNCNQKLPESGICWNGTVVTHQIIKFERLNYSWSRKMRHGKQCVNKFQMNDLIREMKSKINILKKSSNLEYEYIEGSGNGSSFTDDEDGIKTEKIALSFNYKPQNENKTEILNTYSKKKIGISIRFSLSNILISLLLFHIYFL